MVGTRTTVDVQWQDGSRAEAAPARGFLPVSFHDEHDFAAGDFVELRDPFADMDESPAEGASQPPQVSVWPAFRSMSGPQTAPLFAEHALGDHIWDQQQQWRQQRTGCPWQRLCCSCQPAKWDAVQRCRVDQRSLFRVSQQFMPVKPPTKSSDCAAGCKALRLRQARQCSRAHRYCGLGRRRRRLRAQRLPAAGGFGVSMIPSGRQAAWDQQ